jgi:deoxyadenosine/deoxycytidine kinase
MNALQRLINSIVFQTDSGILTDSDSENDSGSGSSSERSCMDLSRVMNNIYHGSNVSLAESESNDITKYIDDILRPRLVSIEGNIGAGKTTIMEKLKKRYADDERFLFIEEPVEMWQQICDKMGKNMIQKYYENPTRYAFAFQIMAFQTRLQLLKEAIEYAAENQQITTILMERSLDADYHIFAKMLAEEGVMEKVEYEIYLQMSTEALKEYAVDGIIWLDTDYEECFRRVEKRGREGEGGLEIRYLRKCAEYHTEWLGADLGFVCRIGSSEDEDLDLDLEKVDNYLN